MGCFGDREKGPPEATAKWDYITLSDFKSTSSWNTLAYMWVWIMAIVAVAVFAADTFTAVNLLAFNRWTSKIEPALSIEYSRWIFAGCIIFSTVLIIISWIFAIRALRGGGIADSYMDPLAATLQSMRGSGWRRFLVFTNLTKSKKGADYVAFFVYFNFQTAIRVIIAEGPRQVINGMTLYEVMQERFFDGGETDKSNIEQFWANLQHLFNENTYQAMTICAMMFTLIIWVISALCLLISLILYITFLWHYIPQKDGRLKIYCRRKIDKRLEKIVESKIKEAIEQEDKHLRKAEAKAEQKAEYVRKKTGAPAEAPIKFSRQPTLPAVPITPDVKKDDKLPEFSLARQDTATTVSTLPLYTSRPPTRNEAPHLEKQSSQRTMHSARPMPSRMMTQSSGFPTPTEEMDAPLLDNAGYAGHVGQEISRPATAMSRQGSDASLNRPMLAHTMTNGSMGSRNFPPRAPTAPPARAMTQDSQGPQMYPPRHPTAPPARNMSQDSQIPPMYPQRAPTAPPGAMRSYTPMSRTDSPGPGQPFGSRPPTAMPYQAPVAPMRQNTPDYFGPVRQDRNASFDHPPPMSREQSYGNMHSQAPSFSRPTPAPHAMNFARPFSPPSAQNDQPLPYPTDSYEMTTHPRMTQTPSPPPAESKPATGYVAFNPAAHSVSSTPAPQQQQQIPQRSVTASPAVFNSQPAAMPPLEVPQRSFTAPATDFPSPSLGVPAPVFDNRATIGYSDIVDDYGRPQEGDAGYNSRAGHRDESDRRY
ncbi:hypothetical protein Q7P37_000402 [Cladosporium fusiforme]